MVLLAIGWVGLIVPMIWSSLDIGWGELLLPFLALFAVLMLYGTLALLLSMVVPSRRLAAMLSGFVVVGSYFVSTLARLDAKLDPLARLSPLNYYQGGDAIDGLNYGWLGGLFGMAGLFVGLAWLLFEHRDIRVGGEGSWHLPLFRRKAVS
jgi:hypothetical protein